MPTTSASLEISCVADALGLGTLDNGAGAVDAALLRDLYHHARGEDGKRVLFENDATFTKGWVNFDSPRAHELVAAFVALDDATTLKQARRAAQNNLEAVAWNDVLGIDAPPIRCRVKIHGTRWGLRFEAIKSGLRGREVLNEALPPMPDTRSPKSDRRR